MFNVAQLLEPVSEQQPCGEDIAFSSEVDAIVKARQADDPSIEQGAWVTTLKEADWKFVAKECTQLIRTRSKDLRLAVWLAEASAKTSGLRALGDGLLVASGLCERYWDGLYPEADEGGFEQRIGNLCWIAARIVQLAREATSTEDAAHCIDAVNELQRVVDERVGADGPSFTAAREALENLVPASAPAAVEEVEQTATAASPGASGPTQSRAQALAQLRQVADFFRRTEPHSPVAYLADKAARWGEQPLHVWLRGVVKDQATFEQLQEMLGVEEGP